MRSIYRQYAEGLSGIKGISVLPFCIEGGEVPQWTDAIVDRRHELYGHLTARGIYGRRFWHPLHSQTPYRCLRPVPK